MGITILQGDCLEHLAALEGQSVHCCVTSPPYWGLRDYGVDGQLGLEATPEAYVEGMVAVFREVRRVLRDDGTLWLNLGDSYCNFRTQMGPGQQVHGRDNLNGKPAPESRTRGVSGLKEKDLVGIPWRVAFALQADGWYLRQDIIWSKPNPMPESVRDRCTKAHEYIFLLSKSERYYFDQEAIRHPDKGTDHRRAVLEGQPSLEPSDGLRSPHHGIRSLAGRNGKGANKRSVWTVTTKPFKGAHFATFPPDLITPCILAGCPENGTVLDPFFGAGTTGLVAKNNHRSCIGIELNPDYVNIARERLQAVEPTLF